MQIEKIANRGRRFLGGVAALLVSTLTGGAWAECALTGTPYGKINPELSAGSSALETARNTSDPTERIEFAREALKSFNRVFEIWNGEPQPGAIVGAGQAEELLLDFDEADATYARLAACEEKQPYEEEIADAKRRLAGLRHSLGTLNLEHRGARSLQVIDSVGVARDLSNTSTRLRAASYRLSWVSDEGESLEKPVEVVASQPTTIVLERKYAPLPAGDSALNNTSAIDFFNRGRTRLRDLTLGLNLSAVSSDEWAAALQEFETSRQQQEHPNTLFNLGLTLEHLRRPLDAWAMFQAAAADQRTDQAVRTAAKTHASTLRRQLAAVHITTPGDGTNLLIDEESLVKIDEWFVRRSARKVGGDPLPDVLTLIVEPGRHAFRVPQQQMILSAKQHDSDEVVAVQAQSLRIGPGAEIDVNVGIKETRAVPITILAVGGAALLSGIVLGIVALNEASKIKNGSDCSEHLCNTAGAAERDLAKAHGLAASILVPAGAVLGGFGAYFTFK